MKFLPVLLLVALTTLRLWLAAALPVTPDEAYHWLGAHRLDWAFFDGPGGTAALVQIGTQLLGDGPLGLRIAFPLLAALASIAARGLGRDAFSPAVGLWTAVGLNALPAFNVAAVHANPALPALTAMIFAAWALLHAFNHRLGGWILGGVALAIGLQFSYLTLAFIPGLLLAVSLSSRHRGEWRGPGLYLLLLLIAAGAFPSFTWNQTHSWPAGALGTWRTLLTPEWTDAAGAFLTSVGAVSFPAFAAAAIVLATLSRSARLRTRPRFILCLALPFFFLWLAVMLHGVALILPLLMTGALLAMAGAAIALETSTRSRLAAAILLLIAGTTAFGPSPGDDPWPSVARALEPLVTEAQTGLTTPLFVIAPHPDATAALGYHLAHSHLGASHPVFLRESQDLSNQFGLWPRYDDFVPTAQAPDEYFKELKAVNPYLGRSALYVTEEEPADLPQTITSAFVRCTPYATISLSAGRKLRVYLCEDYQTMPL